MPRKQKLLLSTLVIGVLCGLTTLGVFGLFSATTQNAGNEISTGTVAISDNDAGSALYNVTGAKPGDTVSKCIRTTYTGTLPSDVHIYSTSTPGPLAQYVNLTITKGTQTGSAAFPDCGVGFSADTANTGSGPGVVFTGTLQGFEGSVKDFGTGIDTDPVGQTSWVTGNSVVFKIDATLQSTTPDTGQGSSSGVHTFVWEARNL
jgi:hypothetical protein